MAGRCQRCVQFEFQASRSKDEHVTARPTGRVVRQNSTTITVSIFLISCMNCCQSTNYASSTSCSDCKKLHRSTVCLCNVLGVVECRWFTHNTNCEKSFISIYTLNGIYKTSRIYKIIERKIKQNCISMFHLRLRFMKEQKYVLLTS